jgi:hypothetical protein
MLWPFKTPRRSIIAAIMTGSCTHAVTMLIRRSCWPAVAGLAELQRRAAVPFPWRVRAIFQGAEETAVGARQMVEHGAIDDCDAILAVHVDSSRDVGRVGLRIGTLTANCDEIRIQVRGEGGHAARPHETTDPLFVATLLVQQLYAGLPRAVDSRSAAVVTFGQFRAGHSPNVIPSVVQLAGTMRTLDRTDACRARNPDSKPGSRDCPRMGSHDRRPIRADLPLRGERCTTRRLPPPGRRARRGTRPDSGDSRAQPGRRGFRVLPRQDPWSADARRLRVPHGRQRSATPSAIRRGRASATARGQDSRSKLSLQWSASHQQRNAPPRALQPPQPLGQPEPSERYHGEI